jgi:hypothetical protein
MENKRLFQRASKESNEKYYLLLSRKRNQLYKQKSELPWVELEKPIQRGWKRFFVLRDDVQASSEHLFFQILLDKINTFQYSSDRNFRKRGRRYHGKRTYKNREQFIKVLSQYEYDKLNDKEQCYFNKKSVYNKYLKRFVFEFNFRELWRYKLVIEPNIVTKIQQFSPDLESEIDRLNDHINSQFLLPKICKAKSTKYGDAFDKMYRVRHKYKFDRRELIDNRIL